MNKSRTGSQDDLEERVKQLEDDLETLTQNLGIINGNTVEVIVEIIKFMGKQGNRRHDDLIDKIEQNCNPDPPGCGGKKRAGRKR